MRTPLPYGRTILKLLPPLLLLAAGAAVNVAVAWGCSLMHQLWNQVSATPSLAPPPPRAAPSTTDFDKLQYTTDECRVGSRFEQVTDVASAIVISRFSGGWPWLAMRGQISTHSAAAHPVPPNMIVDVNGMVFTSLLIPLWPGFAVNTLFYAAVLWVLFAIPGALRRMIRSFRGRRGQCIKCAYPIGTNERCTECGASVIPAAPRVGIQ